MSVYVDPLRVVASIRKNWPYGRSCHMYADATEELHEMAGRIGLSRSWFQDRTDFPHYDLSAWRRQQAIARGALEVDRWHVRDFIQAARERRKSNQ